MKFFSSLFLGVFFLGACSIIQKSGGNAIQSPYLESNRLTEGAYTGFYNRDLRISEDLYAVYVPHAESNYLSVSQFDADRKLVQQKTGAIIAPHHFVFQLQGKQGEFSTRFYYLPDIRLATDTIKGAKFKKYIYHLYSLSAEKGQIIQLFSLNQKSKEKRKDYSAECDAMIQKLCYCDYYKITQSSDSILVDLSASKFSGSIKTTHHRIISIPANRQYATVSFQFSEHIQKLITTGETLQLSLVDRNHFLHNPSNVTSLITQNLDQASCSLQVEVAYRDYLVIVTDTSGNLYEAICLNVW